MVDNFLNMNSKFLSYKQLHLYVPSSHSFSPRITLVKASRTSSYLPQLFFWQIMHSPFKILSILLKSKFLRKMMQSFIISELSSLYLDKRIITWFIFSRLLSPKIIESNTTSSKSITKSTSFFHRHCALNLNRLIEIIDISHKSNFPKMFFKNGISSPGNMILQRLHIPIIYFVLIIQVN